VHNQKNKTYMLLIRCSCGRLLPFPEMEKKGDWRKVNCFRAGCLKGKIAIAQDDPDAGYE